MSQSEKKLFVIFFLPVSAVMALLAALEHCWSWALRVTVMFWLHSRGGKLHCPSDVELHEKVCKAPSPSVAITT